MSGFERAVAELIEAGRELYRRGWMPATSGNLSVRLDDGTFAVTVSGRHNGRLTTGDILRVDAEGRSLDDRRPSAETALHLGIYRRFPEVRAVLHPHSPAAVLASRLFKGELVLEDHELLKALDGIDTHAHRLVVPIFPNDQNIPRLAAKVDAWIDRHRRLHAYIIAGHGFYAWGRSVAAALTAVEALEFMFDCEVRLYGVRS